VNLKDEWDRLDSETRKWLLDNPGCLVLPRSMSAKISNDVHKDIERDQHGQIMLSRDDHAFLRDKAEAAGTIHAPTTTEYHFFDSTSLP
jgi:hypothetical protein